MEDFFVVPIWELDTNWMMRGFSSEEYALEYCAEVLGVPHEYIEEAILSEDGLEVILLDAAEVEKEDWYIQLKRLSKYANAS